MRAITYRPQVHPWSPFDHLASLRGFLDSAFDFRDFAGGGAHRSGWLPPLDIYENADRVTVRLEAPGLEKEDFDLSLQDDNLTISGERRTPSETGTETNENASRERTGARFSRSVTLPSPVNADGVTANYEDGVLTVTVPKAEEARPRRIEVNVK